MSDNPLQLHGPPSPNLTLFPLNADEESPTSPVSPTNLLMNKWNPMEEAFHSYRNAYTIDIDDPGLATTGNGRLLAVENLTANLFQTLSLKKIRKEVNTQIVLQFFKLFSRNVSKFYVRVSGLF